jgi:hypothetical protein
MRWDAIGRLCCKSLFALVIKIFPGCRRDFRVKMWGTSSPDDKLTGDLGNVIESTKIGGRRSDRLMAGKLSPSNFGLLQHNRHLPTLCCDASIRSLLGLKRTSHRSRDRSDPTGMSRVCAGPSRLPGGFRSRLHTLIPKNRCSCVSKTLRCIGCWEMAETRIEGQTRSFVD